MGKATLALILGMLPILLVGCGSKDPKTDQMEERTWQVPSNFYDLLVNEEKRRIQENDLFVDQFGGGGTMDIFPPEMLPDLLNFFYDIHFSDETSLRFSPNDGELVIRHYPEQLDQIDEVIRSLGPLDRTLIDRKIFHPKGAMVINGGDASEGLITRKWHCAKEVIEAIVAVRHALSSESNPFVDPSDPPPPPPKLTLQQEFMCFGIAFPEGASIAYDPDSEILTSVHHLTDAARIELILLSFAHKLIEEQAAN